MLGLDVILPAAVGIVFIYSSLIIAFVYPEPSPYQVFVFRTVLALAAAGFAAAIPGLLNISINLPGLTILEAATTLQVAIAISHLILKAFWNCKASIYVGTIVVFAISF
jgi:hypothetical protein